MPTVWGCRRVVKSSAMAKARGRATPKEKAATKKKPARAAASRRAKPNAAPREARPRTAGAKPVKAKKKPAPAAKRSGIGAVARKSKARPRTLPRGAGSRRGAAKGLELDWSDRPGVARGVSDEVVDRWVGRGDALLRTLAEHGCAGHEYRADLKEGRFVWLAPSGDVSAEARAQVLCSWSPTTSAMAMGWADPLVRAGAVARLDGMASERDDVDEEAAWRIAMEAADASHAEFLYRIPTPHAWYFVALRELTFSPGEASFTPGTPVGLVLRGLADTRRAVSSRAEPADVVRQRLASMGTALLDQARYAYRDTDWVARLARTGKRLGALAKRVERPSYGAVAAGRTAPEWLDPDVIVELEKGLRLLEDEWGAFS